MILSGKGAELVGGRWNSRGNAMLYTSKKYCALRYRNCSSRSTWDFTKKIINCTY